MKIENKAGVVYACVTDDDILLMVTTVQYSEINTGWYYSTMHVHDSTFVCGICTRYRSLRTWQYDVQSRSIQYRNVL